MQKGKTIRITLPPEVYKAVIRKVEEDIQQHAIYHAQNMFPYLTKEQIRDIGMNAMHRKGRSYFTFNDVFLSEMRRLGHVGRLDDILVTT